MTLSSLLNSVTVLDAILEEYFWKHVDRETTPNATPLAQPDRHNTIALEVASRHRLLVPQAKQLVTIAYHSVV